MDRLFFVLGALSAFIGVGAGAFATHTLSSRLPPNLLDVFETGARYQLYHALGLLAVAWAATHWPGGATNAAGWLFVVGTLFFSGSLYLLALTGTNWLGIITPIGGVAWLIGWLSLAWAAWKG